MTRITNIPGTSSDFTEFVSEIEIIYTDNGDKPENTLCEIYGRSSDVNKGFGGKFVWLRAHRSATPSMIVDHIWVDVTEMADMSRSDDLAKGARGQFRYLNCSNNIEAERFVTDVGLWRTEEKREHPPAGWHKISTDLNFGRGGDYLYIVWNLKPFVEQHSSKRSRKDASK